MSIITNPSSLCAINTPVEKKDDIVVSVKNISKKFCRNLKRSMAYGIIDLAHNLAGIKSDATTLRKDEFWALNDVSFELKKGEALGVMGSNGSGKSTLLRLLTGIFPPDKGEIMIKGKIGALIAVGAGFHPHMTGLENILLNGTILGMNKKEIKKKLDSIIDFAEIGDFLEAPVATYSSGMTVRLGFSIAIHSEPEILLADEVLAVGDLQFVLKCYRKVSEFKNNGGTLILVSHSVMLLRNTCNKALWIEHGKIKEYGDTQSIGDAYENYMMQKDAINASNENTGSIMNYDKSVKITKVEFLNENNKVCKEYNLGEVFKTRIHFDCKRTINKPIFSVTFYTPENYVAVCHFTSFDNYNIDHIVGTGYIDFVIDKLSLKPSSYRCGITFTENNDIQSILEWHEKTYTFVVCAMGRVSYGLINAFPKWILNGNNINIDTVDNSAI